MNTVYMFTVAAVNPAGESIPYSVVATSKITHSVSVLILCTVLLYTFVANVVTVDHSTVSTMSCVTVEINNQCVESLQQFRTMLSSGLCGSPLNESSSFTFGPSYSSCLELPLSTEETCYSYTTSVFFGSTEIDNQTRTIGFQDCLVSEVAALAGSGVSYSLCSTKFNSTIPHRTIAFFSCAGGTVFGLSGSPLDTCVDGTWKTREVRTCSSKFIMHNIDLFTTSSTQNQF